MLKTIDIKSVIIGILGTVLLFVLVGANDTDEPKDIVAKSLTISGLRGSVLILDGTIGLYDTNDKPLVGIGKMTEDTISVGQIETYSSKGGRLVSIGGTGKLTGSLLTFNSNGNMMTRIGSNEDNAGTVTTFNGQGNNAVELGTIQGGIGMVSTYNGEGIMITNITGSKKGNGAIATYNSEGIVLTTISTTDNGSGGMTTYSNVGKKLISLISTKEGDGGVITLSREGEGLVEIGAREEGGYVDIYNIHDKKIATIQSNVDKDGAIGLYDRYGDLGWSMIGKQ